MFKVEEQNWIKKNVLWRREEMEEEEEEGLILLSLNEAQ